MGCRIAAEEVSRTSTNLATNWLRSGYRGACPFAAPSANPLRRQRGVRPHDLSGCRRPADRSRRRALPRAARPARHPADARRAQRHGGVAGEGSRVRGAVSVRRGDDRVDGHPGPRHDHGGRGVLLRPPDHARHRTAAAGRWRHRLRRGAQRHAHGAQLRGCRRGGGAHRGPVAAEEMRPPERQEAGRRARHGGQDRRRAPRAPAPVHRRAHRCRRQRGHGRRGGAREAVSARPAPMRSSRRR